MEYHLVNNLAAKGGQSSPLVEKTGPKSFRVFSDYDRWTIFPAILSPLFPPEVLT